MPGHEDEVTPDGSPVLLYRRLRAGDEPRIIDSVLDPGSEILELGAGAGRVTHPLDELGHRVVAVDESAEMLRWISGAETVVGRIEELDLGRRFDAVILASHFVNVPEDSERQALLAACERHVRDAGVVLIEHHHADWAETAVEGTRERDGVRLTLSDVRREPPFVSATMVYEIDGHAFRQPFTARVLRADEMARELERAGLRFDRQLTPTWVLARPARWAPEGSSPPGPPRTI